MIEPKSQTKKRKLLFVVNNDHFFISHRLPFARAAMASNWEVYLLANDNGYRSEIESNGIAFIGMTRLPSWLKIVSPLINAAVILKTFLVVRPDVIHNVTIRPVLIAGV